MKLTPLLRLLSALFIAQAISIDPLLVSMDSVTAPEPCHVPEYTGLRLIRLSWTITLVSLFSSRLAVHYTNHVTCSNTKYQALHKFIKRLIKTSHDARVRNFRRSFDTTDSRTLPVFSSLLINCNLLDVEITFPGLKTINLRMDWGDAEESNLFLRELCTILKRFERKQIKDYRAGTGSRAYDATERLQA